MAIKLIRFTFVAVFTIALGAQSFAAGRSWKVDSGHSEARISVGSPSNPNSQNVGVALADGKIDLTAGNPAASVVDLNLAAASNGTSETKIAFKSTSAVEHDGEVDVIGDLTLTRIERTATYNPSEAYAGPVFGEPVTHVVTRQVVFVFPSAELAQQSATAKVSGTALIGRENFPELLPAINNVNWPPVVQNETCQAPSVGEDSAGPSCTGVVAEAVDPVATLPSAGENYHGSEITAPAGNQVKIVLSLQLNGEGSAGATEADRSGDEIEEARLMPLTELL
jgi:hypothetical protein